MDPDPRVQVELENLNTSTEFINKLELELEKARSEFNQLLCESKQKIEYLNKKLSSSINKSRPYYEARTAANELHSEAQKEAIRYGQATTEHIKAKEIVHLAEESRQSVNDRTSVEDSKWEQILTKSAEKVNMAESERISAEKQHEITSRAYSLTEQRLSKLHKQLKRSIVKASLETRRNLLDINNYANQHQLQLLPYFEMKAQFNQMLDEQINKIRTYESRVNKAKLNYTKALQRLEELNNEIYDSSQLKQTSLGLVDSGDGCIMKSNITSDTSSTTTCEDDNIFDNKLLSQLVLQDDVDSELDRIRNEYAHDQQEY